MGCGLGPPEKPPLTDPGGAGTSTDLTGLSPAITNEFSDGTAAAAVSAGGGAAMVAGSAGAAACFGGATNWRCCLGSGTPAVRADTAGANSGAAGNGAGSAGSGSLGAAGGVNRRIGRGALRSRTRGFNSGVTASFGAAGSEGAGSGACALTGGGTNRRAGGRGGGAIATMLGKGSGLAGVISGAGAQINCGGRASSLGPAARFWSNIFLARRGRASRLASGGVTSGKRSLSLYQTIRFSLGWISRS